MTDELTPEQDAVRRLLAEARHDAPTPDEVVARLDDALASLVAERSGTPLPPADPIEHHAVVVDLGARRRRLAGIGLLAAAAVVVGGVALGQGLPRLSGSDDASSASAGDMATSQEQAPRDDTGGSDAGSSSADAGPESLKSAATAPEASYPTLSADDANLDDELLDLRAADAERSTESGSASGLMGCDLRGTGQGRRISAQVDGQVGVVVFRRPDGAAQQVDLYVCGTSVPVRTLTLPAP